MQHRHIGRSLNLLCGLSVRYWGVRGSRGHRNNSTKLHLLNCSCTNRRVRVGFITKRLSIKTKTPSCLGHAHLNASPITLPCCLRTFRPLIQLFVCTFAAVMTLIWCSVCFYTPLKSRLKRSAADESNRSRINKVDSVGLLPDWSPVESRHRWENDGFWRTLVSILYPVDQWCKAPCRVVKSKFGQTSRKK